MECGILLDNSVIIDFCLRDHCPGSSYSFIDFLQRNPNLGIITSREENRIFSRLKGSKKGKTRAYYLFDELKESLKREVVDRAEFGRNYVIVKDFFHEAGNFGKGQYSLNEPVLEDAERLAEAICLKPKYNPFYFAFLDTDFVNPIAFREIENKFKIRCAYPIHILEEIKTNI